MRLKSFTLGDVFLANVFLVNVLLSCVLLTSSAVAQDPPKYATYLGLSSRAPTVEEVEAFDLELRVRHRGQIVQRVKEGSPAARAGLKPGDAIISFDNNDLYSFDDVRDFVRVSRPGQKVRVRLKHKGSAKEVVVRVELGRKKLSGQRAKREELQWNFASLAQLEDALEQAKKLKKPLLVGISGAET